MNEREAFIAAIAANPGEDTPRLAFADLLQENGEEYRAQFIRLACELGHRAFLKPLVAPADQLPAVFTSQ